MTVEVLQYIQESVVLKGDGSIGGIVFDARCYSEVIRGMFFQVFTLEYDVMMFTKMTFSLKTAKFGQALNFCRGNANV